VVIENGFNPLFDEKGLDLIAVPQDSKIPSMATASGQSFLRLSKTLAIANTIFPIGYPIATMPLGVLKDYGRPFGLAIMARAGREDILFTFMSAFEAEFPKRVIPPLLLRSEQVDGDSRESSRGFFIRISITH
jgi:amidase